MSLFKSKKDTTTATAPTVEESTQIEDAADAPVENAPVEEEPQAADDDEPAICQTSEHLKSYPLIKEAVDMEIVKAIRGTSNPILKPVGEWLHSQSFLKPIIRNTDGVVVSTLDKVEQTVPSIKTVTWKDVGDSIAYPFKQSSVAIETAKHSSGDFIGDKILLPTREYARKGRAYYNEHLYDTQGKPLLRSSLDPVCRPINYQIEDFTLKNFPKGEPVSNDYSSEVERGLWLTYDLMERAIPVAEQEVFDGIMAPCNYTSHAFEVYNEHLAKQEGNIFNSSIQATYNTSVDLTNEVISETTSAWNKIWKKSDEPSSTPEGQEQSQEHTQSSAVPAMA
ncbi:Sporulation-specific protein [Wickerhamomyces ciferrii]|uniref:Sporulation-specific protein n=1 Tax=Wickerhamomyces ciferrii (strain ATCC 14091 / BCRC 22168 / CBS 111 / JCM 3599 / NBRC 0793 / NRRL Y-1031 F-60-10) TaxID=1206466 RepID=K0KE70_WICCF|nr:Sporulation-specific protein [Wickerhamomyces ciferrii]CCH43400.1 Sporulation-specific protein [Wickerhamomyces ciferrii]